ncbi:MAG: TIGR02301 family protein [Hyphomicrobiales bacterium]
MIKISKLFLIAILAFVIMGLPSKYSAGMDVFAKTEKTPVYESRLLRLSEIIGSIHFLSLLCKPDDGLVWHNKMNEMLEAEEPSELRRARLVARFNSGFSSFQATYRKCTPPAQKALDRYIAEAQVIVQNLTSDFTG